MQGSRFLVTGTVMWAVLGAPAAEACEGAHARLRASTEAKVRRATVCLVNEQREQAGLRRLRTERHLERAATSHSRDMVARGYFDHDGPAGDTMLSRAQRAGYLDGKEHAYGLAENLAIGVGHGDTAAGIVRQWMDSPPHRANILLAQTRDVGVGLAEGRPDGGRGMTATLDVGYAR